MVWYHCDDVAQVRGINEMLDNVKSGKEQVVDARGAGRFKGTAPEIRPGMRSGHIPGRWHAFGPIIGVA